MSVPNPQSPIPNALTLQCAAGHFDNVSLDHGSLHIDGWMLLPEEELDYIAVHCDQKKVGLARRERRDDVRGVYRWIPHAGSSGFRFETAIDEREIHRVDLIGFKRDRPHARLATLVRPDLEASVPTVPPHLAKRGAKVPGLTFKLDGLKMFTDLSDQIDRYGGLSNYRCLLDWGCGCGRVTVHFLATSPRLKVFGSDIDAESINWCRTHLQPGHFLCSRPNPPTDYDTAVFDLVIACSVFTHLSRKDQSDWLDEIRRIMVPGGLFLASTHGQFAFPSASKLSTIIDRQQDPAMDGIAPKRYYRVVYQARDYTVEEWSKYFDVLDYVERGLNGHQDLVVMQRR